MYNQEEIVKAYGPYQPPQVLDRNFLDKSIAEFEAFPEQLRNFCRQINPGQFDACYREGGWSYRQVIHHLADSHLQAFVRFKLALTEDNPHIKPYIQNAWAGTADSLLCDPNVSAGLVEGIHHRMVVLMKNMSDSDFERTFYHPEQQKNISLANVCGLYAWHGKHHLTQIKRHAFNMGWINSAD